MDQIDICGISARIMNAEALTEYLRIYMEDEYLNLAAFLTQSRLVRLLKEPEWTERYSQFDWIGVGETEVLEAVGIRDGEVFEELGEERYFERFFWQIVKNHFKIVLLGEDQEKTGLFRTYLEETYPEIRLIGCLILHAGISKDAVLNKINSIAPDLILGGMDGVSSDQFILENRNKICGKLWISLGENAFLQRSSGFKNRLLEGKLLKHQLKQIVPGGNK